MSSKAQVAKTWVQSLKQYVKAPWKITGPCASPEYKLAVPKATEYRPFCPATIPEAAIVPSANPDTVFDIKYFPRDQRRNRPPIRKTVLKKDDVAKMMSEKTEFQFPQPYLTAFVEEDLDTHGGGYQK